MEEFYKTFGLGHETLTGSLPRDLDKDTMEIWLVSAHTVWEVSGMTAATLASLARRASTSPGGAYSLYW